MLRLTQVVLLFFFILSVQAQRIEKRLILIGDAGEINSEQSSLIDKAVSTIKSDSTIIFYLGDNIYPSGMSPDSLERVKGMASLRSQFEPFRAKDVPVYFLAGNHDWNTSKPEGLQRLKAQEKFLKEQKDKGIQFVPQAGKPGPTPIAVAEGLVVVAWDSEYWLYPHHDKHVDLDKDWQLFKDSLKHLLQKNTDNVVLLLSHHPMMTYGEHSLSFGLKQHIFPLTRLHKNLYIALPIIGSLYPLWRGKILKSTEDLPHPKYQNMVSNITEVTKQHPNLLFIAGHDHGLQFIEDADMRQIVSGSGSKSSFIRNHKNLKFKYDNQGFCLLDYYDNGNLVVSYYTYDGDDALKAFETTINKAN